MGLSGNDDSETRRRAHIRRLWLAGYCLLAALPLAVVLAGRPVGGHRFVVELSSALGTIALTLLALQLTLPARVRLVARPLGAGLAIRLHRHITDLILAAIVAHLALVVVGDRANLVLFDPIGAPWRAKAAIGSCVALGTLIVTSVLRRKLRLSYRRWRGVHNAAACAALVLGFLHAIGVGRYLIHAPAGLLAAGVGGVGLVELRVLRPRRLARRPYVIELVKMERGGATTLLLRADAHRGHPFRPGQFAWLRLAEAPYSLVEHPFSYSSSSSRPDRPAFTIKPYGEFTTGVRQLRPGTRMLVDGPHGSYSPPRHAKGFVLIAGGIGITPIMSLLRSAADRGDLRPFVLVYGSVAWPQITFREQLQQLEQRLDLRVVHVLEQPPPGWNGEMGLIDDALLRRQLPADRVNYDCLVCGPPPMITATLNGLERLGVATVHVERFVTI